MDPIPPLVKSGYRCSYCQSLIVGQTWELDHVQPRSQGGDSSPSNLVTACSSCNRNKGDQVSARDPLTGLMVPVFNPLAEEWDVHFTRVEGHVVGGTPVGRATAALLFRSTKRGVPPDLKWGFLTDIEDETLYWFLNHQRALRLSNRFALLGHTLTQAPQQFEGASESDNRIAHFVFEILNLEVSITRSLPRDMWKGIRSVDEAERRLDLDPAQRSAIHNVRSILYQQLATQAALEGLHSRAQALQEQSIMFHLLREESPANGPLSRPGLLRFLALVAKHERPTRALVGMRDVKIVREQVKAGDLLEVRYLADATLVAPVTPRHGEEVAVLLDEALQMAGYGQDFDLARSTGLRRRWWPLRILLGEETDANLFAADVSFWREKEMENEIREVSLALMRQAEDHRDLRRRRRALELLEVVSRRLISSTSSSTQPTLLALPQQAGEARGQTIGDTVYKGKKAGRPNVAQPVVSAVTAAGLKRGRSGAQSRNE